LYDRDQFSGILEEHYVRCVRGGWGQQETLQPPSGTIVDTSTGLMWQKEPFEFGLNWHGAVEYYCNNLEFGGFSDWTLPFKGDFPGFEEQKQLFLEERRNNRFWTHSKDAFGENAYTLVFTPITYDRDQFAGILEEHHVRCVRGGKGHQESESESSGVFNKGYFQLGSTTDELRSVMGNPDEIDRWSTKSFWIYENSKVEIQNGKVAGWENKGNLKLR